MAAVTGHRDKTKANSPIISAIVPENTYTSRLLSLFSEYDHRNWAHIRKDITLTSNGVTYRGSRKEKIILNRKNSTNIVITKATIRALLKRFIVRKEEIANMFSVRNNEYAPNRYTNVKIKRVNNLAGTNE